MSNFMGVGILWIGLNRADLGCWRLTLRPVHTDLETKNQCLIKGSAFHFDISPCDQAPIRHSENKNVM